jgi:DNA-directed RNA polymerase subunit RPC12/RpoP
MLDKKKFTMIDEDFICEECGRKVKPLGYTARDHCPYCLFSKHVDINPGDRANECCGILEPIGIASNKKGNYQIIYRCQKCGVVKKNIIAKDDNMDLIIKLSILG